MCVDRSSKELFLSGKSEKVCPVYIFLQRVALRLGSCGEGRGGGDGNDVFCRRVSNAEHKTAEKCRRPCKKKKKNCTLKISPTVEVAQTG